MSAEARSPTALRRILTASAMYAVAGTLGKIAGLVTVPIVARALGPAEYGLIDLATAMTALLATVGGLSAELPAARLASQRGSPQSVFATYIVTVLGVSAGLGLLAAAAHGWIASELWRAPAGGPIALAAAAAVPLTAVQWASWNLHRLHNQPGAYATLATLDLAVKVGLIVLVIALGHGAGAVVAVYLLTSAAGAAVGLWSTRASLAAAPDWLLGKSLVAGGVPFMLIGVAFVSASYAVRSVLSMGPGTAAVGEMAVAVRLASVVALPLAAFQLAWGPVGMAMEPTARAQGHIGRSTILLVLVGGLSAIVLSALGREVIAVIAGGAYSEAAEALPGLAVATVLAGAFFMIAVAASVADLPRGHVIAAAVTGAIVQVVVTAIALTLSGAQFAVGTGAIAGHLAAVATLLATTRGYAVRGTGTLMTIMLALAAVGLAVQWLNAVDMELLRWLVAAGGALALAGFLVTALRPAFARGSS